MPTTKEEMLIRHQQAVADYFIALMRSIDPYVCVAGGAPRDWFLGKPAADIDIFYQCPTIMLECEFEPVLKLLDEGAVECYMQEDELQKYLQGILGVTLEGSEPPEPPEPIDFKNLGLTQKQDDYELNPDLLYVHNAVWQGVKLQFMAMQSDVRDVHETFPLNISQAKYTSGRGILGTTAFHLGHSAKSIWKTGDAYNGGQKYMNKIQNKFKDYSWDEA